MGHTGGEDDGPFWSYAKYEAHEAYLHQSRPEGYAQSWQIIELYRKRADCENDLFDELKNQLGFNGFPITENAARLLIGCL